MPLITNTLYNNNNNNNEYPLTIKIDESKTLKIYYPAKSNITFNSLQINYSYKLHIDVKYVKLPCIPRVNKISFCSSVIIGLRYKKITS